MTQPNPNENYTTLSTTKLPNEIKKSSSLNPFDKIRKSLSKKRQRNKSNISGFSIGQVSTHSINDTNNISNSKIANSNKKEKRMGWFRSGAKSKSNKDGLDVGNLNLVGDDHRNQQQQNKDNSGSAYRNFTSSENSKTQKSKSKSLYQIRSNSSSEADKKSKNGNVLLRSKSQQQQQKVKNKRCVRGWCY